MVEDLNDPGRLSVIHAAFSSKAVLRRLHEEVYRKYGACLSRCPRRGLAVELGSGGGFAGTLIPELITTDLIPYKGIRSVVDATRMPFADESVRFFGMLNVFHHIPDVAAFLAEATRCLVPGGRVYISDQHLGWISYLILRYLHDEPFAPKAKSWEFETTGPLSGANGALAWMVFVRDLARFQNDFPNLRLEQYKPTTPLRYWLSGGLKKWSLLPEGAWGVATALDTLLLRMSPQFGSFVDIELVRM